MPVSDRKLAVARKLATSHLFVDDAVREIFLLQSKNEDASEPIVLLEVVEGTVERGIEPVYFRSDAARGIDFPSVIIELSPREWAKYGELKTMDLQGREFAVTEKLASR